VRQLFVGYGSRKRQGSIATVAMKLPGHAVLQPCGSCRRSSRQSVGANGRWCLCGRTIDQPDSCSTNFWMGWLKHRLAVKRGELLGMWGRTGGRPLMLMGCVDAGGADWSTAEMRATRSAVLKERLVHGR